MQQTLQGIESLSDRQKEVLRLTAQHLQAKEIARILNITERTVRAHTESARRRLGATTSREAVRIFLSEISEVPIGYDDQWPSTPIAETTIGASELGHEQALFTSQRSHDDQLHPAGNRLENVSGTRQMPTYSGRHSDIENAKSGPGSGEGSVQSGSGWIMVDGRWGELRGRLKSLSALSWLGLILLVGILLPLFAGVLIQAVHGTFEALQILKHG
ncbi:MAG: helix-turn-helix transcriptional regulator [Asticcacaulis sp.]